MLEGEETHKEIVTIKADIKDIKATQELDLRLNEEKYRAYVDQVVGNSKERAMVLIAVNGRDSLRKISEKTGLKEPNVNRSKRVLEKRGLIFLLGGGSGRNKVYGKPRWVSILNIDDYLREKFGIEIYE
jgi:predicted transcriptional regulator